MQKINIYSSKIKTSDKFISNNRVKVYLCGLFLLLVIAFFAYVIHSDSDARSFFNIITYLISLGVVAWGLLDILKRGICVSNVFACSYFAFLAFNCFYISGLQVRKSWSSIYYLVIGSLLFIMILRMFETCRVIRIHCKTRLKPDLLATVCFVCFVFLKMINFYMTGIRLFDHDFSNDGAKNYMIGGLSGLSELFMWISLMFIPVVKKKLRIVIAAGCFLLYGVFAVSRNNMMTIAIFLAICLMQHYGSRFLNNRKLIRSLAIMSVVVLIAFTLFGNYRQQQRGWNNVSGTIEYLLESKSTNSVINWTYAYTSINYDVLLQCMVETNHPGSLYSVLEPLVRLFGDVSAIAKYNDAAFHIHGLNGFNASTIWGPTIYELGDMYLFGVFLLGLIVGIWILIARSEGAKGFEVYLVTWAAMSVFGNFYTISVYFFTSIAACAVFLLVETHESNLIHVME